MTRRTRLALSVSTTLPTLLTALVVFAVLAFGGVRLWNVLPTLVLALAVQALVTYFRLGRPPAGTP
ncbi:hypothetical protein ACPC54_10750 [Kitasatospora sp. NPDC094028]